MKHRKVSIAIIFILCALLLTGCGSRLLKEIKLINENAKHKFLIASDSSEFKDEIRNTIIEKYKNTCSIEIVNIEKLSEKSGRDYDFVLIMLEIQDWGMLNPEMRDFIDKTEDKKKIIMFATSMNPYYEYDYEGVDAVTSASNMENKYEILEKLTAQVDSVLGGK